VDHTLDMHTHVLFPFPSYLYFRGAEEEEEEEEIKEEAQGLGRTC